MLFNTAMSVPSKLQIRSLTMLFLMLRTIEIKIKYSVIFVVRNNAILLSIFIGVVIKHFLSNFFLTVSCTHFFCRVYMIQVLYTVHQHRSKYCTMIWWVYINDKMQSYSIHSVLYIIVTKRILPLTIAVNLSRL